MKHVVAVVDDLVLLVAGVMPSWVLSLWCVSYGMQSIMTMCGAGSFCTLVPVRMKNSKFSSRMVWCCRRVRIWGLWYDLLAAAAVEAKVKLVHDLVSRCEFCRILCWEQYYDGFVCVCLL